MAVIGVFDSGVGGLSVARALEGGFPDDTVIFMNDQAHMPYGDKPPETVLNLTIPIIEALIRAGSELIVIACNTVSTTHIKDLRARFDVPFVAIEPMVKPAAELTQNGVIGVCATPATLASKRYAWLKQTYASGVQVLEPDCRDWARMIERKQMNEAAIAGQIETLLTAKADVIVLGCTHYHWIEAEIKRLVAGRALVIQPEQAIVRRVRQVLARHQAR